MWAIPERSRPLFFIYDFSTQLLRHYHRFFNPHLPLLIFFACGSLHTFFPAPAFLIRACSPTLFPLPSLFIRVALLLLCRPICQLICQQFAPSHFLPLPPVLYPRLPLPNLSNLPNFPNLPPPPSRANKRERLANSARRSLLSCLGEGRNPPPTICSPQRRCRC